MNVAMSLANSEIGEASVLIESKPLVELANTFESAENITVNDN